jgi:hypothetical protein
MAPTAANLATPKEHGIMPEREMFSLEEAVEVAAREHRLVERIDEVYDIALRRFIQGLGRRVLALEAEVAALKAAATGTTNPPAAMHEHGP